VYIAKTNYGKHHSYSYTTTKVFLIKWKTWRSS